MLIFSRSSDILNSNRKVSFNGKNKTKNKNKTNERKSSVQLDSNDRRPSIVVDLLDDGTSDFDSSSIGIDSSLGLDSSEIDSRKGSADMSEKLATSACNLLSRVKLLFHFKRKRDREKERIMKDRKR